MRQRPGRLRRFWSRMWSASSRARFWQGGRKIEFWRGSRSARLRSCDLTDRSHDLRASWPDRQALWTGDGAASSSFRQRRRRGALRTRSAARDGRAQRRRRARQSASSFASAFIWATSWRSIDGKNLMGDGVNIAARLEGVACEPGGICLSEDAYRQAVKGRPSISRSPISARTQLKNIAEPIRGLISLRVLPASPRRQSPQCPRSRPTAKKSVRRSCCSPSRSPHCLSSLPSGALWFLNANWPVLRGCRFFEGTGP